MKLKNKKILIVDRDHDQDQGLGQDQDLNHHLIKKEIQESKSIYLSNNRKEDKKHKSKEREREREKNHEKEKRRGFEVIPPKPMNRIRIPILVGKLLKQKIFSDGGMLCKSIEKESGARVDYEELEDGKVLLVGGVEETSRAFSLIVREMSQ